MRAPNSNDGTTIRIDLLFPFIQF
uniref:Uncharacterized protein n=1 Tax=Arundo donax TaxID=35708 RepID=A0A0A9FZ05_ARUDO